MKFLLVALLACLCALSLCEDHPAADRSQRQRDIFRLFHHIHQATFYKDHIEIADKFDYHANAALYSKPEVVERFHHSYTSYPVLKRGEIFSVYYYEHLREAIALFELLYHATSYDTFYKTAVWAREHLNEGVFVYAFSVALVHRPDTYYLVLPPIYEIFPNYFYGNDVIQQAQYYRQLAVGSKHPDVTVYANYSGYYLNLHEEQSLSYFTEDVRVNAHQYYYQIYYPFWLDGTEYNLKNDRRGEVFFHHYQQFLARYYLERLSHGFGEIPTFDWQAPFETGFRSSLHYPNGLEFPTRPNHVELNPYYYNYGQKWSFNSLYAHSYQYVTDYERRFRDAVDIGYYFNEHGQIVNLTHGNSFNLLGNLVEGNPDSEFAYNKPGAYQVFAHHLLGYAYQPLDYHRANPSALEHFETQARDPAFYQFYKKVLYIFYKHLYRRQPYTQHQLEFNGVHIKNVEFDRLITYFDTYHADLTNALYYGEEERSHNAHFEVQVQQKRLTHKPFHYKLTIESEHEVDAVVRVFLGPKYDEYGRYVNLSYNFINFVQFDHFTYKLKAGENVITKNSEDIDNYFHDRVHYHEFYEKAHESFHKDEQFQFPGNQFWYGFPQEFYLPIGSHDGTAYQFFVFVYPQKHSQQQQHHGNENYFGSNAQYVDEYSLFYPFDRPVHSGQIFHHLPNAYFHEAKVYHRSAEDVKSNVSH